MTKKELIKQLQPYSDDTEVYIINTLIIDDEEVPGFSIDGIDSIEGITIDGVEQKAVALMFSDAAYIDEMFLTEESNGD